ncbi:unnamed protein product [Protopolystoma xenopodis]|uniref:Uncharacterized protein n=1 Tax=Protopolystoma xenopodis TaxID=117903 RepID=A0A3S5AV97_9PLAT|nr:unnamed protein product [Protopolystoma xenopodis]
MKYGAELTVAVPDCVDLLRSSRNTRPRPRRVHEARRVSDLGNRLVAGLLPAHCSSPFSSCISAADVRKAYFKPTTCDGSAGRKTIKLILFCELDGSVYDSPSILILATSLEPVISFANFLSVSSLYEELLVFKVSFCVVFNFKGMCV